MRVRAIIAEFTFSLLKEDALLLGPLSSRGYAGMSVVGLGIDLHIELGGWGWHLDTVSLACVMVS